jgi:hypothetical protein
MASDSLWQQVRAEIDGFVVSWETGVDKMEGQSLGTVGTPDGGTTGAGPFTWQQATGGSHPKL